MSRADFSPYSWMPDWARRVRQPPELPTRFHLCYPCNRGESCLTQDSRLLIFAKFLKSRVAAERIEHGVEPKECGSERPKSVRYRE
jgi:hypothetical protein